MIKLNPLTLKKIRRFKTIKRGYYAFIIFAVMISVSLFAELLINKRAIIVHFQGSYYFPTYGDIIPGTEFGLDYAYETNYRQLATQFKTEKSGNWVLMPPVPYDAFENDLKEDTYPPFPPSFTEQHYLGTDTVGRDMVARLVYGFRIAIFFSLALLVSTYIIGISIGCAMGFWGGLFDLFFQRIIEIWSNMPVLYVIIIIASIISPTFTILLLIMVFFSWTSMTWTMRTITYKEKTREYVLAAK
ncbi:MAG: ABC transporter permease, partial [Deltaproteobacteria bacterium]|nr:ABC transporter permease [Deltaproteobacteria bacterium]